MAEPAAREAWDKSISQAQPYLDKLPEIKDLLNSKTSAFLSLGAGALGGRTKEIWDSLKSAAEAKGEDKKKKVEELKNLVEEKAKQAQDAAASSGFSLDSILGFVKQVPGGEEASRPRSFCSRSILTIGGALRHSAKFRMRRRSSSFPSQDPRMQASLRRRPGMTFSRS
jgi:hypothetical protein